MDNARLKNNIIRFENIITLEESEFLINLARTATDKDWDAYRLNLEQDEHEVNLAYSNWKKQMLFLEKTENLLPIAKDLLDSIHDRCINKINKHFNSQYTLDPLYSIFRFERGDFMKEHHDSGLSSYIKYGLVIYLNDNFEGGEIYYPNLNLEMKAKSLSLHLHPANSIYRHGVKEVLSGERFTLAAFVRLPIK
jgi:hypothetical protein